MDAMDGLITGIFLGMFMGASLLFFVDYVCARTKSVIFFRR